MQQYKDLLKDIMDNGTTIENDRTGTGTKDVFARQLRFNLSKGFPLVTTKFTPLRLVAEELFWFLRGETNITSLAEKNVHIWDGWATADGEIGPMYGKQWVGWECLDGTLFNQIDYVINTIKKTPNSRRIIINGWNCNDLPDESVTPQENVLNGKQAITPCHAMYQWTVLDGKLNGQVYIRSSDSFLGLPFNIASLALLTHMIAQQCGLAVGDAVVSTGSSHIYSNHYDAVNELLDRNPMPLPHLSFNSKPDSIYDYTFEDINLGGYNHHPAIKAPVSV